MTDALQLDQAIRERAIRDMKAKLQAWFGALPLSLYTEIRLSDLVPDTARKLSLNLILQRLTEAALAENAVFIGNAAVQEFIKSVEETKSQLDDLVASR